MTDLTKIEIALGQMARHVDRLATATERIAASLEKATGPMKPEDWRFDVNWTDELAQAKLMLAKTIALVDACRHSMNPPNPYGVDTW